MSSNALAELVASGPTLSVGILTADLGHLEDQCRLLEAGGAGVVHIDVMDGVFCPMLTVGPPFVAAMKTPMLKDVHLMIDDPLTKVDAFVAAGADMITFHLEGASQPRRVLTSLRDAVDVNDPTRGIVRGAAINPSTGVDALEPLLDELEYILILAIDPGWGGQAFSARTAHRLAAARELIERSGRAIVLGVDGGVTRDNIADVAALGADVIVTGSAIFDGKDAAGNLALMQRRLAGAIA